ncbi:MAG: oligosaccharide flippase family protein, partial [Candidatus Omnitrophica bacterium]|nr:oligosaccharide flippase family protein [Candidatus Omnitrophota bacterium]
MSFSQKIIHNTFYNALGRMWTMLAAVALTPYIMHHIGVERFGIWAVVGVITGYFGLFDLGVGTSFIKYIAQYHASGDEESISRVVTAGCLFYFLFALLLIVASFFLVEP